jgi:hypothetical protein
MLIRAGEPEWSVAMSRLILLGGILAVLLVAGAALTLKIPNTAAAQHAANPAEPIDPAMLTGQLRRLREEGSFP